MRMRDKVAIVVGGGQTRGDTLGNGRATALLFARQGAKVVVADRDLESAQETAQLIVKEGGAAVAERADITSDAECAALVKSCVSRWGRLDVLHNNVGIGSGDGGPTSITDEAWDGIFAVNVKGVLHTCRHALPVMREQESGVILNVSSIAAVCAVGLLAYKSSKAALNALTHSLATGNAKYGIRVNGIMPGLINTPMAIENISSARGIDKQQLIAARDKSVPLKGGMGSAWDVAHAALFLASDEAKFITGVILPVDGGQSARIG
ncbi:MAG TPA: SDR family oxidoreductase [Polyangiales bacterium]|nr:SDR family oxidoreductase [Polyangiales bacterium]